MWTQVQQMRQNPVIAVEGEAVAGAEELQPWDPITYYIPGFTVAFAFFLIGQMATTLLREKEEGTFRRLMSSPMPRGSIIGGKMLAYMIVVFLQVIVLFGVGYALFQMPLGESPLALLLLTLALALASASMGMLLGALCTHQQAGRPTGHGPRLCPAGPGRQHLSPLSRRGLYGHPVAADAQRLGHRGLHGAGGRQLDPGPDGAQHPGPARLCRGVLCDRGVALQV